MYQHGDIDILQHAVCAVHYIDNVLDLVSIL